MFIIGLPFLILFLMFTYSIRHHFIDKLSSFKLMVASMIIMLSGALAARGRSTFSELRWYPPMEAAKGSLSWVFRAKQPESVRTGP